MSMAREYISRPRSRPHTTMTGVLTHHIPHTPATKPVKGVHTRTDKAPMSTSEYKGHIGKYARHLNGTGHHR